MADLLDPAWSGREEPANARAYPPASSAWTTVEWAVVTRSGMLQARCYVDCLNLFVVRSDLCVAGVRPASVTDDDGCRSG
jgi:hypothetical protein